MLTPRLHAYLERSMTRSINYDVVTIGETMLRLTPPNGLRWEQSDLLQVHIGGSESNTAVGLARLGHPVAWISKLTDNPLGRKIASAIAAHGVDTQHVLWTQQDRIGTYYYEEGSPPRGNQVLYDRAESSFSKFSFAELPTDLFAEGRAKLLHVTGISLGVSNISRDLIQRSVKLAKAAGWKVSFDVNYRAKLWSPTQARDVCNLLFADADFVFLPIRDAKLLWGLDYDQAELESKTEQVAARVAEQMSAIVGKAALVMTLGSLGSCALSNQQFCFAPTQAVPAVGRLGGGDAFTAGFLSGVLQFADLQLALRWGNAAAAIKYSIPGDIPYFNRKEVELLACGKAAQQPFR